MTASHPGGVFQPVDAKPSLDRVTASPSSVRSRFSSRIRMENGSASMLPTAALVTASSRYSEISRSPTRMLALLSKLLFVEVKPSAVGVDLYRVVDD